MHKPTNMFLLATKVGALSAALAYRHLSQLRTEIEAARVAAAHATVGIVVASQTIPVGTSIERTSVKIVPWPKEFQPDGALSEVDAVVGKLARATIEKNQPIAEPLVVAQGTGLMPLLITEGMRAMSVKVDNVTGVSGFITPSSRVDVLVSGTPDGNGSQEQRSKVILQNIRVLATGTSIEQRNDKPVEVPTVTLLVSPEDAEKLTLATRQEPVRLALRNYRDEDVIRTPGISTHALLGGDGTPVQATADTGEHVAPRYAVEILRGEQLTLQKGFRD